MKKRLYETLLEYKRLDRSSFHTPGHKNNFFDKYNLLSLDYTELPLTDSLYESSGAIKASEEAVSALYGSEASFFSAGGNTLCIQAMIRMCVQSGEKILCDRLAHRSAISAMALLGIIPIWLKREVQFELPMKIDISDLKEKLKKNPDIKAVYITSPSYHGVIQDISLISNICKSFGVALLVDNAHGAHLKFLGLHPLDQGATCTADSAHKTLPVLTSGAWLHVNDRKLKSSAKAAMALFGSTSPSYAVMSSMDICCRWLESEGINAYKELEIKVQKIKKIALEKNMLLENTDPVRITLCAKKIGYTGFELRNWLYKFKIEPELCDKNYVVLIPTPFNTKNDWLRLETALKSIKIKKGEKTEFTDINLNFPECKVTLSEAIMSDFERISVKDSLGRIAAEIVCPCPPGVPTVMPGEKIGIFQQKSLVEYGVLEIDVLK